MISVRLAASVFIDHIGQQDAADWPGTDPSNLDRITRSRRAAAYFRRSARRYRRLQDLLDQVIRHRVRFNHRIARVVWIISNGPVLWIFMHGVLAGAIWLNRSFDKVAYCKHRRGVRSRESTLIKTPTWKC